jgi:GT2 family glycosyltransferase
VSPQSIEPMVSLFQANLRLGVVSFRVLRGDSLDIDPQAWVFRRSPEKWADRTFPTFSFTGGGSCIRADAFQVAGGFWELLQYSREEEDLGLALMDQGWEIIYSPAITIRHYADQRGRSSLAQRRNKELRNGIMVLWRRLPAVLALLGIGGRILTMSLKMRRDGHSLVSFWQAVPEAIREWRQHRLKRVPIALHSALKYAALHFQH